MRKEISKKVIKETYGNGDIFYKVQFNNLKYIKIFGKEHCIESSNIDTLIFKNEEDANAYADLVYKPSIPLADCQCSIPTYYKAYKIFTKYDEQLNKLRIKWFINNNNISHVLFKYSKIDSNDSTYIIIANNLSSLGVSQTNYPYSCSYPTIEKSSFERFHFFTKSTLKNSDKAFQIFIQYVNDENAKYEKEKYEEIEAERLKNTLICSEVVTTINNDTIETEKECELQEKLQNETNILHQQRSKIILDELKRIDEYKENLKKLL